MIATITQEDAKLAKILPEDLNAIVRITVFGRVLVLIIDVYYLYLTIDRIILKMITDAEAVQEKNVVSVMKIPSQIVGAIRYMATAKISLLKVRKCLIVLIIQTSVNYIDDK